MKKSYSIAGKVKKFPGSGGWYFVQANRKTTVALRKAKRGFFGSLKVSASIGKTAWKTTMFPAKKNGPYMVALKADIRKKENITAGKVVKVKLEIR